ncbi:13391_t:CDS:2 [Dentiscutata erythropus]|uniref:13391_t:CDS:1 n=1 Tax=Dentiscutata erythropus TaxID=1348616 RepID=A0A9N9H4L6_9GLOM|nr:13391_t:CDS:2 [Dentiscutata erythropus]
MSHRLSLRYGYQIITKLLKNVEVNLSSWFNMKECRKIIQVYPNEKQRKILLRWMMGYNHWVDFVKKGVKLIKGKDTSQILRKRMYYILDKTHNLVNECHRKLAKYLCDHYDRVQEPRHGRPDATEDRWKDGPDAKLTFLILLHFFDIPMVQTPKH